MLFRSSFKTFSIYSTQQCRSNAYYSDYSTQIPFFDQLAEIFPGGKKKRKKLLAV